MTRSAAANRPVGRRSIAKPCGVSRSSSFPGSALNISWPGAVPSNSLSARSAYGAWNTSLGESVQEMQAVVRPEEVRRVPHAHLGVQLARRHRRDLRVPEVVRAADRCERAQPEPWVGAVLPKIFRSRTLARPRERAYGDVPVCSLVVH